MIKHDYKPQNDKIFFKKGFFEYLPAWVTHPFMILSMATLIMLLTFLLSKEQEFQSDTPAHPAQDLKAKNPQYDSGEMVIQSANSPRQQQKVGHLSPIELSNYSLSIEIPLQIKSMPQSDNKFNNMARGDQWLTEAVRKGDNLSLIFKRIGLSAQTLHKIITLDNQSKKLTHLRPGQMIYYQLNKNKKLLALKYIVNLQNTLYIERKKLKHENIELEVSGLENSELENSEFENPAAEKNDTKTSNTKNNISKTNQPIFQWVSRMVNKTVDYRTAYVNGTITDSLFLSGKKAGLSDTLLINLANIFDWDIDFFLDIRSGDSFSVLYQEKFLDGEKIGDGDIIAAEFINQGEAYRAVKYTNSKGNSSYYTPSGLNMRKAFLRAPIKFSYISSGFKPRRFHPILKRWKAHRGIDYRANTGTPIRAAGDGKVTHSSRNQYNGKYVFIQHGQGIITKYLHMSRRAVSRGKRVKQGQVIGYVGSTGLSQAPHLHYEFLVNGVHRNPRTVKLPKAEPIAKSEKQSFLIASEILVNQLESRQHIQSHTQVAK